MTPREQYDSGGAAKARNCAALRRSNRRQTRAPQIMNISGETAVSYGTEKHLDTRRPNDPMPPDERLGSFLLHEALNTKEVSRCIVGAEYRYFSSYAVKIEDVKKPKAICGVHYASTLPQFYEMVCKYKNDYSKWPSIPSEGDDASRGKIELSERAKRRLAMTIKEYPDVDVLVKILSDAAVRLIFPSGEDLVRNRGRALKAAVKGKVAELKQNEVEEEPAKNGKKRKPSKKEIALLDNPDRSNRASSHSSLWSWPFRAHVSLEAVTPPPNFQDAEPKQQKKKQKSTSKRSICRNKASSPELMSAALNLVSAPRAVRAGAALSSIGAHPSGSAVSCSIEGSSFRASVKRHATDARALRPDIDPSAIGSSSTSGAVVSKSTEARHSVATDDVTTIVNNATRPDIMPSPIAMRPDVPDATEARHKVATEDTTVNDPRAPCPDTAFSATAMQPHASVATEACRFVASDATTVTDNYVVCPDADPFAMAMRSHASTAIEAYHYEATDTMTERNARSSRRDLDSLAVGIRPSGAIVTGSTEVHPYDAPDAKTVALDHTARSGSDASAMRTHSSVATKAGSKTNYARPSTGARPSGTIVSHATEACHFDVSDANSVIMARPSRLNAASPAADVSNIHGAPAGSRSAELSAASVLSAFRNSPPNAALTPSKNAACRIRAVAGVHPSHAATSPETEARSSVVGIAPGDQILDAQAAPAALTSSSMNTRPACRPQPLLTWSIHGSPLDSTQVCAVCNVQQSKEMKNFEERMYYYKHYRTLKKEGVPENEIVNFFPELRQFFT